MDTSSLTQIVAANRTGRRVGICSVCSAHPMAVEAALRQGAKDDAPVLIEATANQVNQFGGYTGMLPTDFRSRVASIAATAGTGMDRLVLGGDHLGPTCWTDEPAARAMAKSRELVAAYVAAGFKKIHLDTSMPCDDDPVPLAEETVAMRAAELCRVAEDGAEREFGASDLVFVIGTEVPIPGGALEGETAAQPTRVESARRTIEAHRSAFQQLGLHEAWERVIALVVQPGVEFDNASVSDYAPDAARPLKDLIGDVPNLVFEAHSTDYQTPRALADLVRDHFAILKVGPQLTHAVREALFALSHIEDELIAEGRRAALRLACERAMLADPTHWRRYCAGDDKTARMSRSFGYSDRIRYYWTEPVVSAAVDRLVRNLSEVAIPLPLLEQYMPLQSTDVRNGFLDPRPKALLLDHVTRVTDRYARACNSRAAGLY